MKETSKEFKEAIKSDSMELKARVSLPGLVVDDTTLSNIDIDEGLVYDEDFEVGTAPMSTAKIEMAVEKGGPNKNLVLQSRDEVDFATEEPVEVGSLDSGGGGRNLLLNSKDVYLRSNVTALFPIDDEVYEQHRRVRRIPVSDTDFGSRQISTYTGRFYGAVIGEQHTWSIKVKPEVDLELRLYWGETKLCEAGKWTTLTHTHTATEGSERYYGIYSDDIFSEDFTPWIEYKDAQVVRGSENKPYSPAPEDILEYEYEDKECEIEIGLVLPETTEYVSMGLYTIEEANKKDDTITLRCVDRMYKAEKEYVSVLSYPTSILSILQSACSQAGIELATTSFANSTYIVPNEPVYEGLICRDIFAQVAELAGGYALINSQGKLEIITLGNTPVRDITQDNYFDYKRDDVAIGKIDKVIVKVGQEQAVAGTGDNLYTVVDNLFVQNPNDVVGPLYDVLKDVDYTACDLSWQGDFSLDLGDKVNIDGHSTYILDRKLSYTGGLQEETRAPAKSNVEKVSTGKKSLTLQMGEYKSDIRYLRDEIGFTVNMVSGIEDDLGEKANKADLTALGGRVSEAEGTLLTQAGLISANASSISALDGELTAVGLTLDGIEGEIELKVDKDGVTSAINLFGEEAGIQANRISLEGIVTANSNFKILLDGSMEAKSADLTGKITASEGSIGGWDIITDRISTVGSPTGSRMHLYSANATNANYIAAFNPDNQVSFYLSKAGKLYARDADIEGSIIAGSGTIGGWVIKRAHIDSRDDVRRFFLASHDDSSIYYIYGTDSNGSRAFSVSKTGALYANKATISGSITSSTITGGIVRTSSSGDRIQMSDNLLRAYRGGTQRVRLDTNSLRFYNSGGTQMGYLQGASNNLSIYATSDIHLWGRTRVDGNLEPVYPVSTKAVNLGASGYRWLNVYLQNNPNVASDIRFKEHIQDIPDELLDELKEIEPKMYMQSGKWHFGYIAQDVERALYKYALNKVGFDDAVEYMSKFEFLHKDESYLSLIYAEIAVLKDAETQRRINELENKLNKIAG